MLGGDLRSSQHLQRLFLIVGQREGLVKAAASQLSVNFLGAM
jgi:DNA polymerase III delta subunit